MKLAYKIFNALTSQNWTPGQADLIAWLNDTSEEATEWLLS